MLGGTAELTFHRNGLEYVIRFPEPDPEQMGAFASEEKR
jgi:hypothetical protein